MAGGVGDGCYGGRLERLGTCACAAVRNGVQKVNLQALKRWRHQ